MSVPELVMNALEPLMTHCPSTQLGAGLGVAGVRPTARLGEPERAQRRARVHSCGSHSRFCSSVPNRKTGMAPSPTAASSVIATTESARASSSMARHSAKKSPPMPPYSSGKGSPNSPISPICRTTS